ncbi:MAG: DUF349 domain-containing protein [Bifidobacteriaceae bacterium]|jgi:hypothetical protein|nr:DUF349 domain-containing protein [Bifidobacteriaceae bacterium]
MENKTKNSSPKKSSVTIVKTADEKSAKAAEKFGRVDSDGTVWLIENGSERKIGEYKVKEPKDALKFYVKRYLDIVDRISLFEARMKVAKLKKSDIDASLANFHKELEKPSVVGDVAALRERLAKILEQAEIIKLEIDKNKALDVKQTITKRIKIVNDAEKLANKINDRINWKQTSEKFSQLLEQWSNEQKTGPRIPKDIEEDLWNRFSKIRRAFENARREFYSSFNKSAEIAKKTKQKIIDKAKELSQSEKWDETQAAFKALMQDWKAAGRAKRSVDDKLWDEFKGYMGAFYDKKGSKDEILEEEYQKNYEAKLAVIEDMKKLLPVNNSKLAREKYRAFMSRINDLGKVPVSKIKIVRDEIEKVDKAIAEAENKDWQQSDPRKLEINQKLSELKKKLESQTSAKLKTNKPKTK